MYAYRTRDAPARYQCRFQSTRSRAFQEGLCLQTCHGEVADNIRLLPASAAKFHGLEPYEWGETLQAILEGVHDNASPLNVLRGKEDTLVQHVFSHVTAKWAKHVTLTLPAFAIGYKGHGDFFMRFNDGRRNGAWKSREDITRQELLMEEETGQQLLGLVAYAPVGNIVNFPEPADRDVNMMPFIFGDKESLPDNLKCYYDMIEQCPYLEEEVGKVGYLTVRESYVDASQAQRREGIHIEAPGVSYDSEETANFNPGNEHNWGLGVFRDADTLEGGIYVASTVSDTTAVWDALVDKSQPGIVDRHGSCEPLRPLLGPGKKLRANELVWLTDRTPHEALPQQESGYRQFFRVVTSNISHWFADHSTENSLVPLPENVVIVRGNKFEV